MGLFQSLKVYKIDKHAVIHNQFVEVLKQQVEGKYFLEIPDYSKSGDSQVSVNTFKIKKNSLHGLLLTLSPAQDEYYSFIYTVPYTPNTLLRYIVNTRLYTLLPFKFVQNNSTLDVDVMKMLTSQLKAQPVDGSFI